MPQLGSVITAFPKRDRIQANNKVRIPDGTRPAEIIDIWIFNVDADGKFTKEKTGEQKVAIKIRFQKRPDIVLEKRMRAYLSEKSHFAKLIGSLTGIKPGSDEMRKYDSDLLVGKKVLVTTSYDDPYTNIASITPAEVQNDGFDAVPPQTNSAAPGYTDDDFTGLDEDEIPF